MTPHSGGSLAEVRIFRFVRIVACLGLACIALPGGFSVTSSGKSEVYPRPSSGVYQIMGRGHGHGRGMSQQGAQGAATQNGQSYQQILAAYYPGTTLRTVPSSTTVRVQLTQDDDNNLTVRPAPGLRVRVGSSSIALPTSRDGARITLWRVRRDAAALRLESQAGGSWRATPVAGRTTFSDVPRWTARGLMRLVYPDGAQRDYRGELHAVPEGNRLLTVNAVRLEDYLRSVVPAEMISSWHPQALAAQSVAARSYTMWWIAQNRKGYDLGDTTRWQVYPAARQLDATGKVIRDYETSSTDKAVSTTAGVVLDYRGQQVFAEFSASNGGHSAVGDWPYLSAQVDPWDGLLSSAGHSWQASLPAQQVEARWPEVGTLRRLQVLGRDGSGEWGGRISQVTVAGSQGTVTVSGSQFATATGLRSAWWRPH